MKPVAMAKRSGSYLYEARHLNERGILMGIGWLIGLLILFIVLSFLVLIVKISIQVLKIVIILGLIVLIVFVVTRLLEAIA
jgi:Flp pilus assembly protein TadB